jgi:hypothetical protein
MVLVSTTTRHMLLISLDALVPPLRTIRIVIRACTIVRLCKSILGLQTRGVIMAAEVLQNI